MESIPLGGLISRNRFACKWKAPSRCWLLREAAFGRVAHLLTQSHALHQQHHGLDARILLRSGFVTLATLRYLNQLIHQVLDGRLNFHLFAEKTSVLLLGSRDGSTNHQSLNIVAILGKCDRRHPGLAALYGILSESAHPNHDVMAAGYSKVDHDEYETHFSNHWMRMHGDSHISSMELCMMTFRYEYDDVCPVLTEKLERRIVENDDQLETNKNIALRD